MRFQSIRDVNYVHIDVNNPSAESFLICSPVYNIIRKMDMATQMHSEIHYSEHPSNPNIFTKIYKIPITEHILDLLQKVSRILENQDTRTTYAQMTVSRNHIEFTIFPGKEKLSAQTDFAYLCEELITSKYLYTLDISNLIEKPHIKFIYHSMSGEHTLL